MNASRTSWRASYNTSTRGIRISWRLCPTSPETRVSQRRYSSDDDIEDRRIEEEDLKPPPAAAEPERRRVRRAAGRLRDAAAAVESPRSRAEGPAEAETLPEAAESERIRRTSTWSRL